VRSSDDGPGVRIVDRLLNRHGRQPDLRTRACHTFGSPWLDPVLRGIAAADNALGWCAPDERALVDDALEALWRAAVAGQALHHAAPTDAHLARAAATHHAQVVELADELEHHARDRRRRHAAPAGATTDTIDHVERLRALRHAHAELDGSDAEAALEA
jgi:hypothetical protein